MFECMSEYVKSQNPDSLCSYLPFYMLLSYLPLTLFMNIYVYIYTYIYIYIYIFSPLSTLEAVRQRER